MAGKKKIMNVARRGIIYRKRRKKNREVLGERVKGDLKDETPH